MKTTPSPEELGFDAAVKGTPKAPPYRDSRSSRWLTGYERGIIYIQVLQAKWSRQNGSK